MLAENWAFAEFSSSPHQRNFTSGIDLIGPDVAKIRTLATTMLKIEKIAEGNTTVLRLVGRINAQYLDELNQLIADAKPMVVKLDLSEVTLVDIEVVRFFGDREKQGLELVGCSPYIREWIQREQTAKETVKRTAICPVCDHHR
jgi:anti-anti-sigma regulatory factor